MPLTARIVSKRSNACVDRKPPTGPKSRSHTKSRCNTKRTQLGCPQTHLPVGPDVISFNEQWFDKGHMFFMSSGPVKLVIAAYGVTKHGEEGSGTWQQFPSEPWSGKDENFLH